MSNYAAAKIFGIAGLVGAGRTELLRSLFGLDHTTAGVVKIAGNRVGKSVRARMNAGFGMLSEDRKREGLAQDLSIIENTTLGGTGCLHQVRFHQFALARCCG